MKKLIVLCLVLSSIIAVKAQDSTSAVKQRKQGSNTTLATRPKDHFMFQIGYNSWTKKPDSIQTKGLSRSANIFFMFDFPFKTNPHISVGLGVGASSDNVYFKDTYIDISGKFSNKLTFQKVADTNHFKKYKLNTTYLEVPLELRFLSNPSNVNSSWKAAVGIKVGTLVGASTKGKNLLNKSGSVINSYTSKEKAKKYFNSTRLNVMGRIGYGVINLYASYQLNTFVKEGFGPDIRPLQFGIVITGL